VSSESERGPRRYAKPFAVPERLDLLVGPSTGVVTLPRQLSWSGGARYDLDQPGRIIDMYRAVINEATQADDLHRYLNEHVLRELWSVMWLPVALRHAWERRFPDLVAS
jgi:hypothetical protein